MLIDVLFLGSDRFEQAVLSMRDELSGHNVRFLTRSSVVIVVPDEVEFVSGPPTTLITREMLDDAWDIAYGPEHVREIRFELDEPESPSLIEALEVAGFQFDSPFEAESN